MQSFKIFSMGLIGLAMAAPAPKVSVPAADVCATAQIIQFYGSNDGADYCDTPFSQSDSVISSDTCIDLGEDDTTKSVLVSNLVESNTTTFCYLQAWKDEKCSSAMTEVRELEETTCIKMPKWSDNSTMLGSMMLRCS